MSSNTLNRLLLPINWASNGDLVRLGLMGLARRRFSDLLRGRASPEVLAASGQSQCRQKEAAGIFGHFVTYLVWSVHCPPTNPFLRYTKVGTLVLWILTFHRSESLEFSASIRPHHIYRTSLYVYMVNLKVIIFLFEVCFTICNSHISLFALWFIRIDANNDRSYGKESRSPLL